MPDVLGRRRLSFPQDIGEALHVGAPDVVGFDASVDVDQIAGLNDFREHLARAAVESRQNPRLIRPGVPEPQALYPVANSPMQVPVRGCAGNDFFEGLELDEISGASAVKCW